MSRSLVSLREAELPDAPVLVELWADGLRRADRQDQEADLELIIKGASASPEQRLIVAEYDGRLAGAILLRVAPLSALNLEQTVQAVSPHVFPQYRRHGIGRALMECAVGFAEELGVAHVATAATSGSRDANRFMARLALGPHATLRLAPTAAVRAKLTAQRPALAGNGRQLTRVLAARRSMRRAQVFDAPEPR
ncbi:GNAT family N-acetyltransferase [Nocardioides sp. cx-173]|uniref:GNAT family N-acetyltransferase n=1 Tax=Nocardioides sp. cx-173 TaxID=2898796 RepID=UPI001E506A8D|nr:GNAT family N-acetyltransferase [Nocardioides sp. cx-173]MCD4526393.1 GNAT family N-acetyltransferase [Nocardioides sp. cx-173]UGB43564.1 GNAT family N-acetyltransferase [Nocardioides sp. cx-173]